MTEATEAKARIIIERVTDQLNDNLAALLMIAKRDGCTVVISIMPNQDTAVVDFQPPKRKIKLN